MHAGNGYAGGANGATDAGLGKKFSDAIAANAREKQPPSHVLAEARQKRMEDRILSNWWGIWYEEHE